MKWETVGHFQNIMQQCTAEFNSNSTANIKFSKCLSFFSYDFEQVLYKEKKYSHKKIFSGVVALKISRKLPCGSSSCNVVGCKLLTNENLLRSFH